MMLCSLQDSLSEQGGLHSLTHSPFMHTKLLRQWGKHCFSSSLVAAAFDFDVAAKAVCSLAAGKQSPISRIDENDNFFQSAVCGMSVFFSR